MVAKDAVHGEATMDPSLTINGDRMMQKSRKKKGKIGENSI